MATTNAIIPTTTLNGIASAIKAKDGGGNMTAAQMADRIAAISTGGWTKPSDWPDLPALLAADTASANPHGVSSTYRVAVLVCSKDDTGTTFTVKSNSSVYYESGVEYTGGGTVYSSGSSFSVPRGLGWFIVYGGNYTSGVNGIALPVNTVNTTLWVYGDSSKNNILNAVDSTTVPSYSRECVAIQNAKISGSYRVFLCAAYRLSTDVEVDAKVTDSGNYGSCLSYIYSGIRVKGFLGYEPSSVVAANCLAFANSYGVVEIPDYISLRKLSATTLFSQCYNLVSLPKVIVPNTETASSINYDFSNCSSINPSSLAKFASDGTIDEGFASFPQIPTGVYASISGTDLEGATSDASEAAGTRTLTMHKMVMSQFTSTEISAIETALYNMGWELAY